jgi:hypothetical protein
MSSPCWRRLTSCAMAEHLALAERLALADRVVLLQALEVLFQPPEPGE